MANNETDYVIFNNGKMFAGKRKPHSCSGYKNSKGTIVNFRDIPLYMENGEPDMKPSKDGMVPVTWDQKLDFAKQNSYRLHRVIHKDVIEAIRDYPRTVTSKHPHRKTGFVIEYEPEIAAREEESAAETILNVYARAAQLLDDEDTNNTELVLAHLELLAPTKGKRKLALQKFISKAKGQELFLDAFDGDSIRLKDEYKTPALIKLAQRHKIIVLGSDFIYRIAGQGIELGSDFTRIHSDYNEYVGHIVAALNRSGVLVREKLGEAEAPKRGRGRKKAVESE